MRTCIKYCYVLVFGCVVIFHERLLLHIRAGLRLHELCPASRATRTSLRTTATCSPYLRHRPEVQVRKISEFELPFNSITDKASTNCCSLIQAWTRHPSESSSETGARCSAAACSASTFRPRTIHAVHRPTPGTLRRSPNPLSFKMHLYLHIVSRACSVGIKL